MPSVTLFFSFRSPYSWLAFHRIVDVLGDSVAIEHVPVYPPDAALLGALPDSVRDELVSLPLPDGHPNKQSYVLEDVARFASEYGLEFRGIPAHESDWSDVHAAFLAADALGMGRPFGLRVFERRFRDLEDVGRRDLVDETLREIGVEPEAAWKHHDMARLSGGFARFVEAKGFGVPLCVFRGERFFGNDRLEWLARAIERTRCEPMAPDEERG